MADSSSQASSNPLAGLLTGSSGGDQTWGSLTNHERAVAWGQINDVYMQILGRRATMAEAQKGYSTGISNYALGQQLMMSKEFRHTSIFKQIKRGYAYELQQFVGHGFKIGDKLAQSFAAHNYTTTDLQAWVYNHPHVYEHSNDYLSRVAQMKDTYQQVFGIDPYAGGNAGTHQEQHIVKTNKGRAGGPPMAPPPRGSGLTTDENGNWVRTKQVANDPLLHHINQAALHFQTPDQYRAWLMNTPAYKTMALAKVSSAAPADAGLTLDSRSRPVQKGLGGQNQSRADVPQ